MPNPVDTARLRTGRLARLQAALRARDLGDQGVVTSEGLKVLVSYPHCQGLLV